MSGDVRRAATRSPKRVRSRGLGMPSFSFRPADSGRPRQATGLCRQSQSGQPHSARHGMTRARRCRPAAQTGRRHQSDEDLGQEAAQAVPRGRGRRPPRPALEPDRRSRRSRQPASHRQWLREPILLSRVEMPAAGNALELVFATIHELEAGARDEVLHH